MPEGDGTVLDNSCLMFLSNMWQGRLHTSNRLPVGAGGRPRRNARNGTNVGRLLTRPATRTGKLCSLYLGIMDRMGMTLDRFGDADDGAWRICRAGLSCPP